MTGSPTPEDRETADAELKAKEAAEQATLPYKWTQTIKDLDVTIQIDGKYKGRDLDVKFTKSTLKVAIKGQDPIIDGELPHAIRVDESTWTLETTPTGKEIAVHLDKANKLQWWAHVITTAPKIDTSKIQPENSNVNDLDGETQTMVRKMMFDQQQKQMGKPTSDEQKKIDMLENFKKQHPEMDFSNAKIG